MVSNTPTPQPVRILLDTNILIDWLIQREPWFTQAQSMWAAWDTGRITFSVPTVSLTTVAYVTRRVGYQGIMDFLRLCVTNFDLVNVTKRDIESALKMPGSDFEDNVQIACAKRAKCAYIVTRNPRDFADAPIPAVDPVQLMQSLPA